MDRVIARDQAIADTSAELQALWLARVALGQAAAHATGARRTAVVLLQRQTMAAYSSAFVALEGLIGSVDAPPPPLPVSSPSVETRGTQRGFRPMVDGIDYDSSEQGGG